MQDTPAAGERLPDAARGRLALPNPSAGPAEGRVAAGPEAAPAGRSDVHVDGRPVGLLYVPRTGASRLVVLLHGAGGSAAAGLELLIGHADERQLMLFAPQSVGSTWDLIRGGYGPDVTRIQQALTRILGTYRVARPGLVIGGFSDGASYALSLGLRNGDLVDAVLAFSPGFAAGTSGTATPAADPPGCFISHGRSDRVLPIDRCSRRIVPTLRDSGYPVHYAEFAGGHEVPGTVVDEAMDWLGTTGAKR
ncbi:MAG TPA: phospholipase [Micromonosporaceae bacterium]|nr:phospholipase [Micromonosporaceae bacterium]